MHDQDADRPDRPFEHAGTTRTDLAKKDNTEGSFLVSARWKLDSGSEFGAVLSVASQDCANGSGHFKQVKQSRQAVGLAVPAFDVAPAFDVSEKSSAVAGLVGLLDAAGPPLLQQTPDRRA